MICGRQEEEEEEDEDEEEIKCEKWIWGGKSELDNCISCSIRWMAREEEEKMKRRRN